MERPQRKNYRSPSFNYSQNGAYFITVCTLGRKRILSRISSFPTAHGEIIPTIELLNHGKIADKYINQMNSFYNHLSVDQYIIMPDHIHFLISLHEPQGKNISVPPKKRTSATAQFVSTFKRFCNKEYGKNIWQERYFDHVIRNQADYDEVWKYIENNPRKWAMMKQGWD